MISTEETKLRGYTIKYTNSREYHSIKDEIFNTNAYFSDIKYESPIIVDFGAHIGLSVIYFKLQYPNSKIYAYEANPTAFEILNENIFTNNLNDVTTYNLFVDTHKGVREVHQDKQGDWLSTTSYISGSWKGTEATSPITIEGTDAKEIINGIVNENGKIDLLKIDIEGFEVKVLDHIKEELKSIDSLIVEFHPNNSKSFSKIASILSKQYLRVRYIQEGRDVKAPDLGDLFIINCAK